jgi:hypothetical protein
MTDEELDQLQAEIIADMEDLTERQEAVLAKVRRLNAGAAELGREPAEVIELHTD